MDKAFELRHMNGTVLTSLQAYYPNGLSGGTIFATVLRPLFPGIDWNRAFTVLSYLKGRGLLEFVQDRGPRGTDSPKDLIYRLTPAGLDVAAGVTEDPAVLVEV